MYEDRKNSFSIKSVLLQLLIVVLFVLAMIWLFPTKGYLDENYVTENNIKDHLTSLYGRMFADNIESMRDAAEDYFTKERLPKKVGDSVKLTLEEMLEKKLVVPFKDSNNESCDVKNSYVELVKMESEYQMKVQLTCSDYSDYIIAHFGCYEYCDDCEEPVTKPVVKPTPTPAPTPKPVVKKYMYEYKLETQNTYSDWGEWSTWSTTKITPDTLTQVEKETRKELKGYEQVWKVVSYKDETVQTGTNKKLDGTETITKDAVLTEDVYSDWNYEGYITSYYGLSTYVAEDSTVKYVYVSDKTVINCSNVCSNVTIYTYKKYTRNVTEGGYSCDSYGSDFKLDGTKCIKTVSKYKDEPVYETTKKPVYGYVNGDPIYEEVVYYRYRTRTQLTVAGIDLKWSNSKEDKELLDKGYTLTGNVKEA